jgi:hypothetical protein
MNIKTLIKVLPVLTEFKLVPWLHGHHGKGKSETIETYYKSKGWLVFNFRLGTMADVGDMLGLQDFITDIKTGQKVATKFCMPDWLKQCMDFCEANPGKRAAIFMDEINRARSIDLISPVFQMSLDKKLHTYDFSHLNIDIICASNPDTGNYSGVLSLDDKALLSRFVHINFNPSKEEWREYALDNKYNPDITDFLAESPEFLEESDLESFSISDLAKPDRRKWGAVNKLLKGNLPKNEQYEVLSGMIGLEAAGAFNRFLDRDDKPLSTEDILDKYDAKMRKRVIKYTEANRSDLLHNACTKLQEYFAGDGTITDAQGTNLLKFISDIPLGIMFNFATNIYKNVNFYNFCDKNPKLRKEFIKKLQSARGITDGV